MLGKYIQCGFGHENVGTSRSLWLRPWESRISGVKYGIFELVVWLSHCCVTCSLYFSRSLGVH